MRKLIFAAGFVSLFVASSCDNPVAIPTNVLATGHPANTATACATYSYIESLTSIVFGPTPPNANDALGKLANIKLQLDHGNLATAQSKAFTLIEFITQKNRSQTLPGTQAQVAELINDVLCYVGLTPSVSTATNAFVVQPTDAQDTVVTNDGKAGAVLPPGSVSEPTVITIEPIPFTQTLPGTGPLSTKLDQYPGFYYLSQISATGAPLLRPVTVAVCPASSVPTSVRARLRLGHDATQGFELTPSANAAFLTCPVDAPPPAIMASSKSGVDGVSKVGKRASAVAATGGVGGTTGTFSPFGTVDGELTATGGVGGTTGTFIRTDAGASLLSVLGLANSAGASCTGLLAGSAVPAECRPVVTVATHLGTVMQNVPVTFSISQGGGTTAAPVLGGCGSFGSSASVSTDGFGKASVCWNLGATGGVNTIIAALSPGGDVPASSTFSPASLSFSITSVQDISPPAISDPVVTGVSGKDGWYTSNVHVVWSVSDPETGVSSATGCDATLSSNSEGTTYTCSATNGAGLSSSRSLTVKRDATTPTVSSSSTGQTGLGGWFTSDVHVTWVVTSNGPSGLGTLTGCNDTVVTTDGNFSLGCIAQSGAGLASAEQVVAGKRDASAPVIGEPVVTGNLGSNGWYTSNVQVVWSVSDPESGVSSAAGCDATLSENSTGTTYTCSATNGAGLTSSRSLTVKRDASRPSVSSSIVGTPGSNGWFTSDVNVAWAVTSNGPSGLGTPIGCNDTVISTDGNFSLGCIAQSGAGLSSADQVAAGKRDASAPVIADPVVTGDPGTDGWYTSKVQVVWTATDAQSGIATATGCAVSVTSNTAGTQYTCTATNGAGLPSSRSLTVKLDATRPTVSSSVTGTGGTEGWFVSDVRVTWNVDATGPSRLGTLTGCENVNLTRDGEFHFGCIATSGAGLASAAQTATGKRDATRPIVTYSGSLGTYSISQTVSITCAATDATSGVLSTTCSNVQGPAYTFDATNSLSASATDHAGNTGSAALLFRVEITYAGVCALTKSFSSSSAIASSMCAKLDNASRAAVRGDMNAKNGMINAFINEINAQSGKAISSTNAAILIRLAKQL